MLLIMGLGGQLTQWPSEYVDALVARGFRVIAFDNRDIGLSTHFDGQPAPTMAEVATALMAGLRPKLPFTLTDMAADAVGLLDALGIDKAHLVGVSLLARSPPSSAMATAASAWPASGCRRW
jgi:pimeloyl-ACP methyl ester carboxylesterase